MTRKLIAICGAPKAGKSVVQTFLAREYGVKPVDDGAPLRDFAVRHCGLTGHQVYTQEGKADYVVLPGGRGMLVRKFLGELGNSIEALMGPEAIPEMALLQCQAAGAYSFGSTRRKQGAVFKRHGGKVIEIVRPGCEIVNEFDRYDQSLVDFSIPNTGDIRQLERRVAHAIEPYLMRP